MKRLGIVAVGLALVVGIATGCRSSGYSQAEVEATVAAEKTAMAETPPTSVPTPTAQHKLNVKQYASDACRNTYGLLRLDQQVVGLLAVGRNQAERDGYTVEEYSAALEELCPGSLKRLLGTSSYITWLDYQSGVP